MKLKWLAGFILLISLTVVLPVSTLALTDRPGIETNRPVQHDEEGNFVPDPFAEGDALRYGGLFGPLSPPDPWELMVIGYNNPHLIGPPINARDIGFGSDNDRYIAINKESPVV